MILKNNVHRLIIVDFHATWCVSCQMLSRLFAQLSLRSPTAVFLTIDIDQYEDVVVSYDDDVYSFPSVKFIRGGCSKEFVMDTMIGDGLEFRLKLNSLKS